MASLAMTTIGANGPPVPALAMRVTCRLALPVQTQNIVGNTSGGRGGKYLAAQILHAGDCYHHNPFSNNIRVTRAMMLLAPDWRMLDAHINAGFANDAVLPDNELTQQLSVSEPLNDSALALCCCCLLASGETQPCRSCALHCGLVGETSRLLQVFLRNDALPDNCIENGIGTYRSYLFGYYYA